ncbi:unnamed protein product [Effrenium voratum]|nr:unnamed protein product [Effrenium voratum]
MEAMSQATQQDSLQQAAQEEMGRLHRRLRGAQRRLFSCLCRALVPHLQLAFAAWRGRAVRQRRCQRQRRQEAATGVLQLLVGLWRRHMEAQRRRKQACQKMLFHILQDQASKLHLLFGSWCLLLHSAQALKARLSLRRARCAALQRVAGTPRWAEGGRRGRW